MESIKVVGGTESKFHRSHLGRRRLVARAARRVVRKANCSASAILVKPLVVLAARALGPGPLRLRMVKLAHNLGREEMAPAAGRLAIHEPGGKTTAEPAQRAA